MSLAPFSRLLSALSGRQAGLRHRVLRGGVWLILGDLAGRAAGLVKLVVLARLLHPRDFGIVAMANVVLTWFDYFSQTGFALALVRKKDDIHPYLNTFWTVQVLRGFLLASAAFACAPLVAWGFHAPELTPVLRASSAVLLIRGLWNPAVVYLRKELRMEREAAWRVTGALTGLFVAVPLAFSLRNAWALVISMVVGNLAELVMSYVLVKYRPRLELNRARARELMQFGKWIFWSNMGNYLSLYGDTWVVGYFFGAVSVGYYQLAQQFGATPLVQAGGHVATLALPAFSRLRDKAALRSAYLRALRFVAVAVLPPAFLAAVFAPELVRVALGPRWMAVAPFLRMLVLSSAVIVLSAVVRAFLHAENQPRLPAQAAFVKVLSFAALVYTLMQWYGAPGVALAVLLSSIVSFLYLYFEAIRVLGWGWDLLLVFRQPSLCCLPAAGAAAALLLSSSPWTTGAIALAASAACAVLALHRLRALFSGA